MVWPRNEPTAVIAQIHAQPFLRLTWLFRYSEKVRWKKSCWKQKTWKKRISFFAPSSFFLMICQKTSSSSFSSSSSSFFYSSIPKRNIRRFIGLKMTASKNWFAYSAKTRYAKICSIGAGIKSLQESLKSHFKLTALFKLKLIFRLARTIQLICDIPSEFKIKQTSFLNFFVKEKGEKHIASTIQFFFN